MPWYNTTKEKNKKQLDKKAKTQSEIILEWFQKNPKEAATPFEVQDACKLTCPITSVRRALSDLTADGLLVKTNEKIVERFGISNYRWTLNN